MLSTKRVAALSAVLLALNVWIAWRLFTTEYLDQMSSLAGIYIGMARYAAAHWRHLGWWPLWFCGMPLANVYEPSLPLSAALLTRLGGLGAARSYHIVVGCFYCLGPVTLFWLALRLSRNAWASFATGLLYSLASPSAWLVGAIRQDIGGAFHARRLHTAVHYADSPHMAGLTLVPLAMLALDFALERRTIPAYALAACALAAVPLTNIPAATVLALAVISYGLACGASEWARRWITAACFAVFGYLMIGPAMPPSTIATLFANTQGMQPENEFGGRHLVALLVIAGMTAALVRLFARFAVPRGLQFFLLLFFFTGSIALGNYWFGLTLIAQPTRFQLALEMGLAGAAMLGAQWLLRRWRRVQYLAMAAFAVFCTFQTHNYRAYARGLLQPIDITRRSEYKIARWLDGNSPGGRAFLLGSSALWLNAFTDTPQVAGCCLQGILPNGGVLAHYEVGSDDGAGGREVAVSLAWLQALGATTIAVTGPRSTDEYKDYHHPAKFDGHLKELWRGGDDVIYEVPQRSPTLAHAVEAKDLVPRFPENGIDTAPLMPYVAAIEDGARPKLEERWTNPSEAVIRGALGPQDVISVQTAYHPGWHASVNGSSRAVGSDGLGFLAISPQCSGDCVVHLSYDGGAEMRVMRCLSLLTVMAAVAWFLWKCARPAVRR
jgi:hypothetical protein